MSYKRRFAITLSCLLLSSLNLAYATNLSPQAQMAKLCNIPANPIIPPKSAPASALSVQPEVLQLFNQTAPLTNIVAMWKTPIPYLSLGYTIANVNYDPTSSQLTVSNTSYSGMAFTLSGF
ncbi:MAG: hypothetical protein Q7V63_06835 [Gammaproteobacteria bacterium]|nr:hypothetical protein [Gammaproteobacteria bacterium]